MEWFRWYHGACSDAKWPLIARKAHTTVGVVVVVDKAYGPATRNRLLAIVEKGRAQAVQNGINGLQAAWYINLGTKNISRRVFTNGWLSKRGRGSI